MKKLIITLIIFSCNYFSLIAQETWTLLNPTPSYHTAIDVHFTSDEQGFIITPFEVLETSDAGETWELTQNSAFNKSFTKIDFFNSLGIIIGKGGYVLRSNNTGADWTTLNTGIDQNLHSVNIIDENTILVTGASKLYKSFDGGDTWTSSEIPNTSITTAYFVNANIGHVASANGKILKTIDGGQNWNTKVEVFTTPAEFQTLYFLDDEVGYASRSHNQIYKTKDGGESWVTINSPNELIFDFFFITENAGYAAGVNGAMYKTLNGGNSWQWISFQDNLISFTSIYGLFFTSFNSGFAVGNRGHIAKTSSAGNSWESYSPTYKNVSQLHFPTSEIGYARVGNEIFKTNDIGVTWESLGMVIEEEYANDFDFINESTGYIIAGGTLNASPQSSYVYKTTDGGNTWNPTNGGDYIDIWIDLMSIDFVNTNIGFVSGQNVTGTGVFKTENGGDTWSKVAEYSFSQMQFLNADIGYGWQNFEDILYKTIDGGNTWEMVIEVDEDIEDIHFVNLNHGYIIGENALMFKTEDGGANWTELNIPSGDYQVVAFKTLNSGYIANDDGEIHKTEDGGLSWEFSAKINSINDIFYTENNTFLGGTNGKILALNSPFPNAINTLPENRVTIEISPNPSNGIVYISSKESYKLSSITIHDLSGKAIPFSQKANSLEEVQLTLPEDLQGIFILNVLVDNKYFVSEKLMLRR